MALVGAAALGVVEARGNGGTGGRGRRKVETKEGLGRRRAHRACAEEGGRGRWKRRVEAERRWSRSLLAACQANKRCPEPKAYRLALSLCYKGKLCLYSIYTVRFKLVVGSSQLNSGPRILPSLKPCGNGSARRAPYVQSSSTLPPCAFIIHVRAIERVRGRPWPVSRSLHCVVVFVFLLCLLWFVLIHSWVVTIVWF